MKIKIIGSCLLFSMTLFNVTPAIAGETENWEFGVAGKNNQDETALDTPIVENPQTWAQAKRLGKFHGENESAGGSFAGGLAGGFFLGLIGTLIATTAQTGDDPSKEMLDAVEGDDCKFAYIEGFNESSQAKKKSKALGGGLLGTVIAVGVYFAVTSSN